MSIAIGISAGSAGSIHASHAAMESTVSSGPAARIDLANAVGRGVTSSSAGVGVTSPAVTGVGNEPAARSLRGVESVVDRIRADLDAFRARVGSAQTPTLVNSIGSASNPNGVEALTAAMNTALYNQMRILEIGVAFNAGLSASQQSQGSVKTLLEKA